MKGFHLKKSYFVSLAILAVSFLDARGQKEVYMKVQSEGFRRIVIAIPPFSSAESHTSGKIREVIARDLDMSSFFEVLLDPTLGGQSSVNNGLHASGISEETSAAVALEGRVDVRGQRVTFDAHLLDLATDQAIFRKQFHAEIQSIRWLAHQAADEVMFHLIGEWGVASTRIAFVVDRQGAKELAFMDYDGHGFRQITSSGSLNLSPCWSPDGERIAFTSYASGNPDLLIMHLDEGKVSKISKLRALHSAPAWSPDGKKIALTLGHEGNSDIYVMDTKGGNVRRLTSSPAIDTSPSWSPSGREIAFASDRSGSPQVYLMDADGGDVRRLTFDGSYNDSPAWSPRGDRIAFVSREEGKFQIYTIDVNGENLQRVTDGMGSNENPSWSPDGLRLVFSSNRSGRWDIYVVNWDGSNLQRLTSAGGNLSPVWSPRLKHS